MPTKTSEPETKSDAKLKTLPGAKVSRLRR